MCAAEGAVGVRFDDTRADPAAGFRLIGLDRVVEARDPAGVMEALRAVEAGVSEGLWAAGFVTYEAAPAFDPAFTVFPHDAAAEVPGAGVPLLWFGLFEAREEAPPLEPPPAGHEDAPPYRLTPWTPSVDRATYERTVEHIRELIAAGETYQVNHTFRLRAGFDGDDLALYRDLCLAQRSAHCAYLSTGRYRVLSASPELFFEVDGDLVTSRPMKGTARRGRWAGEDLAAAASLAASAKDRAENAMIVDLIRNDLGSIAHPRSVEVAAMFEPERYETVWQLTSTVSARLANGTGPLEVLRALFPCGSVTGAPKVRTMRAIAELEDAPRGVYTGAVGCLAPPGEPGPRARFSVAIRTVVLDAEAGCAEYGVGGGVTWGSSPAGEYDECMAKALVLSTRRPPFELLETMRFEPGHGAVSLAQHLERLRGSAEYFGFAYDEASVRAALGDAVRGEGAATSPQRVRLTLARDGRAAVEVSPVPALREPVRLAVGADPVDPRDPFRYHKTTRRDAYRRAGAARPDADDVILVNDRGEAVETTIANLAVRLDGRWWTPPLDTGCLPGVRRAELLADGSLAERSIAIDDLRRAEALAVLSALRGWRAATLLDRG